MNPVPPIRHISDTALWVAVYRARESERADAVFHDPYAGKLAGDRGTQIAAAMPFAQRHSWSYVARTWLVDQVIERELSRNTDMVINLAAGLDARPYRMRLPASLPRRSNNARRPTSSLKSSATRSTEQFGVSAARTSCL